MTCWTLLCLIAATGAPPAHDPTSDVAPDETVVLFPSYGYLDDDRRHWLVPVHGWIHEPSLRGELALALLKTGLSLEPDGEEEKTFRRRAAPFVVDNEEGKTVTVRVAGRAFSLAKSGANGHCFETIRLPVQGVAPPDRGAAAQMTVVLPEGDDRRFEGRIEFLPPRGVSVISDIDDTIKITQVRHKRKLVENTFLRSFAEVPGMAGLYQRWQKQGAAFHYLTAGPWQLFGPLSEFAADHGFPPGTYHMKPFRLTDSTFFDLFKEQTEYKRAQIETIFKHFPQRQFVLVGDSGEQDPEIYGETARKFPDQVRAVLIRDVTSQTSDDPRYAKAFREVPGDKWRVFTDPAQATDLVGEGR